MTITLTERAAAQVRRIWKNVATAWACAWA